MKTATEKQVKNNIAHTKVRLSGQSRERNLCYVKRIAQKQLHDHIRRYVPLDRAHKHTPYTLHPHIRTLLYSIHTDTGDERVQLYN